MKESDLNSVDLRKIGDENCRRESNKLHDLISKVPNFARLSRPQVSAETTLENSWRRIQLRALSHPHEVTLLDSRGRMCLHTACTMKPPLCVVKTFLAAIEESGNCQQSIAESVSGTNLKQMALRQRDKHGMTPLSLGITRGASLVILTFLVDADVDSVQIPDNAGNLPLHFYCMRGFQSSDCSLLKLLLRSYKCATEKLNLQKKTALHLGIEGYAGPEVVRLLIEAYPQAVLRDDCGCNPLELVIKNQQEFHKEICEILIKTNPNLILKKNSLGKFPLHQAIECLCSAEVIGLLCGEPECVRFQDELGRTSLHMTLEWNPSSFSSIRILLYKAPELVYIRDKAGESPLESIYRRFVNYMGRRDGIRSNKFWKIIVILLEASISKYTGRQKLRLTPLKLLHSILRTDAPVEVVKMALKLYPNEVKEEDEEFKCLPAFLSLRGYRSEHRSAVFSTILDAYPKAGKIADYYGRLLLAQVAEYRYIEVYKIQQLIKRNPAAIYMKDPKTRLYPFMLAATCDGDCLSDQQEQRHHRRCKGRKISHWELESNFDLLQLNTVYVLLNAAPSLVNEE